MTKCDWCHRVIERSYAVELGTVPPKTEYICKTCMRSLAIDAGEHVDDVYDSETDSYWPIYQYRGRLWGFPDPHFDGRKSMLILR